MTNTSEDQVLNLTINGTSPTNSSLSAPPYTLEDLMNIGIYAWAVEFFAEYTIIATAIGLPSNLASMLTFLRLRPMSSSTVFLVILAVVDFSFLFWDMLFLILFRHLDQRMPSEVCRLYIYLGTIMMQSSIWVMVAMTVERFMAVWLPLKVANICTVKRATYTCALIMISLAVINIPYTYTPHVSYFPNGKWFCTHNAAYRAFLSKWIYVDSALYVIIPWPILALCNGLIIVGLRLSAKRKQRLTNSSNDGGSKSSHLSITVMLVTASVVGLLLISPNMIFFFYVKASGWNYKATAQDVALYTFFRAIVFLLSNMNHAINFWLYVISGRRFRKAFFGSLTCRDMSKASKYNTSRTTAVSQLSVSQKVQETEIVTT